MNLPIQHDSFISGTPLDQQVQQLEDQTDHLVGHLTKLAGEFQRMSIAAVDDHSQSQPGLHQELNDHIQIIQDNFTALQAAGHNHPGFERLRQATINGLNAAHQAAHDAANFIHAPEVHSTLVDPTHLTHVDASLQLGLESVATDTVNNGVNTPVSSLSGGENTPLNSGHNSLATEDEDSHVSFNSLHGSAGTLSDLESLQSDSGTTDSEQLSVGQHP